VRHDRQPPCAARFGQGLLRKAHDLLGRHRERRTQQPFGEQARQRHAALQRALVGFGFVRRQRQGVRGQLGRRLGARFGLGQKLQVRGAALGGCNQRLRVDPRFRQQAGSFGISIDEGFGDDAPKRQPPLGQREPA
jgi:hypothetical protein